MKAVDTESGHEANNVIIDVEDPIVDATRADPIVAAVDEFLTAQRKSVFAVANTIFPLSIYQRYGTPKFFDVFNTKIFQKVRKSEHWSGYYFERMTSLPTRSGKPLNPLWNIVKRLRDFDDHRSYNKYEMAIFDAERDVDRSRYGGQCLSFLSFKVLPGENKRLGLTAIYRNHFYTEKLLGNLIGLGRVMNFVVQESGLELGPLTVISTHAQIDTVGTSRAEVQTLVKRCERSVRT
jgi:hypothetical protein